jgi:hypothetical protein
MPSRTILMLCNEDNNMHLSPLDKLLLFLEEDAEELEILPLEEVGEKLESDGIRAAAVVRAMEEQRRNTLGDSPAERAGHDQTSHTSPDLWSITWSLAIQTRIPDASHRPTKRGG